MNTFNYGSKMRGLTRTVREYINSELKDYEISEGQFEYFILIYKEAGISQRKLADLMNVGKASVTKAVKILEDRELIIRKTKEEDQRELGLYVSERGEAMIEKFYAISKRIEETVFKDLSNEELIVFDQVLDKLGKNSLMLKEYMD